MTYDVGSDLLAQTPSSGPTVYFQYDGHGSVRGLVNTGGEIPSNAHLDYDGFGNALFNPTSANSKIGYVGERRDNDLHAIELRDRDYTPANGRFETRDPIDDVGGLDPSALHKYVYASANPVYFLDP